MSRPYGPVLLTAGVASFVNIDASATWVIIENSSLSLDLGVSFQVNSPPVVATFSGAPYAGVIQAGAAKRFTLPVADGAWTGRIWMLPLSVATQSGQTGTGSTYSRAYVTSYNEFEEPTDTPSGVIRGLDLTSQPRIVSLPMGNQVLQPNTIVLPTSLQSAPTAAQRLLNDVGTTVQGSNAFGFVYSIEASAVTVGSCTLAVGFMSLTAAHAAVNTFYTPFVDINISRAGNFGPTQDFERTYATPQYQNLLFGAGDAFIAVYYYLLAGNFGMTVELAVNWSIMYASFQGLTTVQAPLPYGVPIVAPRTVF